MVATDDLVSGGNNRHQSLMEQLKSRYKFGKWEFDTGRFCGKDVQQHKDGSIHVTQQTMLNRSVKNASVFPKVFPMMLHAQFNEPKNFGKKLVPSAGLQKKRAWTLQVAYLS